jgi:hypothetical protein
MRVGLRLTCRARQAHRSALMPSSIGLRLAGGLQLEAMGAQYHVAALAGGRRDVASSVSSG